MSEPDPLAGLRDQIRGATDAAERLLRDARGQPRPGPGPGRGPGRGPVPAGGPQKPTTPPAGWQAAGETGAPAEVAALVRLLGLLRDVLPAELQEQLVDLVRQVLVVLRALIDWAVTRLEADARAGEVEVEDIPIG
jgi:hypothetical protein